MSTRSPSPMEQGEIEASPDLHESPGIILDPDDDYSGRQMTRGSDKDKPSKPKRDSRSPDRHEDLEDALNIQPPQIAHLKKDKHRHHRHGKGDGHKRATRDTDKYVADSRHSRDERQMRKYEDKSRAKHSKREPEMSSASREFAKQQLQQEREVEALRRQKSLQERERLERLERERFRIEKERQMKEREYWAKMKKSEQEQAARNEQERRQQQRAERSWRDDERERQNSDEMMKRRVKEVSKKGGRQRSRTRSRSPLLQAQKEPEKDLRRNASDHRREETREVRRHESWFKDKRGSDQDRDHDQEHERGQEQYLRNKLYSSLSKDSGLIGSSHEDHPEPRDDDISVTSDRSESEEREQAPQEARQSSVSHDESDKSHESNASRRSRSERSQSDRSREEEEGEENEENQRHSAHEDVLRSKFDDDEDDDRRSESGDGGSGNSASSGAEDDGKDGIYMEDSPIHSSPETQPQLPPYFPALQGCRNVEEFQCLNRIEEGTYGVVYRAIDLKTEEVVALKRLKMEKEKEGFPITSLREINTLLKAQHPNIVTVREIVVGSNMDKIYIVMDYVEHDLKSLMEYMKEPFSVGEVKTLLLQLLRGVAHLHDNWIIHRDLKTSNLLLSHKGILKIGDFGLAREYGSPLRAYTPIVVTLWYRTPELLLGAKEYSTPIDLWSVGCIFAEFLTRKPLFPGKSEIDQLNRIFKDLGTPNEKIWPGVSELPAMKKCTFTEYPFNQLQSKFKLLLTAKGLDLLNRFLTYNPEKRVTAENAKTHEFFSESPLPVDPAMFPTWPAKSEQSKSRTHGNSPKPPSGGKAYAKLLGDDEEYGARFHLGGPTIGDSTKPTTGFALKF